MWRERILLKRAKQAQTYRYIQMAVLAFVLSTLFVRGRVTDFDTYEVRFCRCTARHLVQQGVCCGSHDVYSDVLRTWLLA